MSRLTVYLPHLSLNQVVQFDSAIEKLSVNINPLDADWETDFCQQIGFYHSALPWSLLRERQFELGKEIQTVIACDPVLMKMTHRGAYMLGQNQLAFTDADVLKMVAQINETLLDEGEQLLMVDKFSWLYASNKKVDIQSLPVKDLIGKDMFNHSYQGESAGKLTRLNTEIQMLMKAMSERKVLPDIEQDCLYNVHFYDCRLLEKKSELPFISNEDITVFSNNELMKSFCMQTFVRQKNIEQLGEPSTSAIVVAFDSEKECYGKLLEVFKIKIATQSIEECALKLNDAQIVYSKPSSIWKRLTALLKK